MASSKELPFALLLAFSSSLFGQAIAQDSATEQAPAVRVALDGDCCASLIEMRAYVKGEEAFSSQWRGLRYLFLSEEEKVVFDSCPEKYAVAFGGLDIVATCGLEGRDVAAKQVHVSGRNTHRFEDQTYHICESRKLPSLYEKPLRVRFPCQTSGLPSGRGKAGKDLG